MDVTPLIKKDQQVLQSYKGGIFKVSGKAYDGAVIVTPDKTRLWEIDVRSISGLTLEDFKPLQEDAAQFDVFLLGCGAQMEFMPVSLRTGLKAQGISADVMDTGAACRTYNVLMAEGRRVVAALLPSR